MTSLRDRRNLPLLLASQKLAVPTEREPLDRLRLQKGVFLLQERGPEDWRELYQYEPWDWGPFSRDLAVDLNRLVDEAFLELEPVPGRRYPRYRTSRAGEEHLEKDVWSRLSQEEIDWVKRVRAYVTSRSFSQLLREVYRVFPDYAVASRFRG